VIKERIQKYSVDTFTDAEVIHVLTGIPISEIKFNIKDLYKNRSFLKTTPTQLKKLEFLYKFVCLYNTEEYKDSARLDSSALAGEYLIKLLAHHEIEIFHILCLNAQNKVIHELSYRGTVNQTFVNLRDVIKAILNVNAVAVLLGHNHPAGTLEASKADIELTGKLKAALKLVEIKLLDHIIVAENKFTSLASMGLC
jgi:DNA repair protein RadC